MKNWILFFAITVTALSCKSSKKAKPTQDMVAITMFTASPLTLKKGQKAYYVGSVHGSVGVQKELTITDYKILKLIDTKFEYNDPSKSNMTGGDGGKKTFIIKAIKEGQSTVRIKDLFRGQLEKSHNITIIVK